MELSLQNRMPDKRLFRHLKSNRVYKIKDYARLESSNEDAVVYVGTDGVNWVRSKSEFFDGRFIPLVPQVGEEVNILVGSMGGSYYELGTIVSFDPIEQQAVLSYWDDYAEQKSTAKRYASELMYV